MAPSAGRHAYYRKQCTECEKYKH